MKAAAAREARHQAATAIATAQAISAVIGGNADGFNTYLKNLTK